MADSSCVYFQLVSCLPLCAGADVPEAEACSGTGKVASRAGALQKMFDPAADALAERRPLQGLPSQVTLTTRPDGPRARATFPFRLNPRVYFSWPGPHGSTEENMAG